MRISDGSSDVCSSDLVRACDGRDRNAGRIDHAADEAACLRRHTAARLKDALENVPLAIGGPLDAAHCPAVRVRDVRCFHEVRHADIRNRRTDARSEEHTSELQSLMRISYAVFCLKKKPTKHNIEIQHISEH